MCRIFCSLFALVLLVGLPSFDSPAFAAENAEKAELARGLVEIFREEGFLDSAFEGVVRSFPAELHDEVEEGFSNVDKAAIYASTARKIEEIYTIEEIKAYLAFASTDVGRSIVRKRTRMSFALQEILDMEIRKAMPR